MTDSKTAQVNVSQTLGQAIAELVPAELASDTFILVFEVQGQRTFVSNGKWSIVDQLAHDAVGFVHAMNGDEAAADALKQAGRLN